VPSGDADVNGRRTSVGAHRLVRHAGAAHIPSTPSPSLRAAADPDARQRAGPGEVKRLGAITRPIAAVSASGDLQRAAILERNYHGDAYMSRIVRP
jgi:hypothetical protein